MKMDMMKVSIATGQAINLLYDKNPAFVNKDNAVEEVQKMTEFILKCQSNNYDKFVIGGN